MSESSVTYATVRDGEDEWHIECRFADGQKFAAVVVDKECEGLAHRIATFLSEECRKTNVASFWQPIATAPTDNKRLLLLARFNDDGTLQDIDHDGMWESDRESWEMPEIYWFWRTANGRVEEPSHWMYQPEWYMHLVAETNVAGEVPVTERPGDASTARASYQPVPAAPVADVPMYLSKVHTAAPVDRGSGICTTPTTLQGSAAASGRAGTQARHEQSAAQSVPVEAHPPCTGANEGPTVAAQSDVQGSEQKIYMQPVKLIGKEGMVRAKFVSRQHIKDKPADANPSPIRVLLVAELDAAQSGIQGDR